MKRIVFTYLILILSISSVFSQNELGTKEADPIEIEQRLLYAESIFESDITQSLNIIEDNLFIAINEKFVTEEALAYRILGDFNYTLTNYNLALSKYTKALKLYTRERKKGEVFNLHQKMAATYSALKNYSQAVKMYKKALDESKTFKRPFQYIQQVEIDYQIAELYYLQKKYKVAELEYTSVYSKTSSENAVHLKIKSLIGLGKVALQTNEINKAESFFKDAEKLAKQSNNDVLANKAFDLLSELYKKKNDINSEILNQERALTFNENRGNSNSLFKNSTNLSIEYVKQGEEEKALELLNSNVEDVEKEKISIEKINYIKTLATVYQENGLEEKAIIVNQKYEKLLDSFLIDKQKQDLIQSARIDNLKQSENKLLLIEKDWALNEKMIDLLRREQGVKDDTIKKQLSITYILIGGLLIIGTLTFFLFRSHKQQKNNNELLVLKSLRSQMNPHFIFNSLNSVNSFIAKKDERSANKYLAEFSKLMREVLECSQEDFIPLVKEIHILKMYLNLEHFRFNSHFDFTFNVDSKINLDEYQIPPLLLQPFIENAIWHGLRYKDEKGHLWVTFTQKSDFVNIEISDNGIGRIASAKVKTINQKKMKSTGIKNIENRLDIIRSVFKKKLDISITDYDTSNQTGTKVNVKLH